MGIRDEKLYGYFKYQFGPIKGAPEMIKKVLEEEKQAERIAIINLIQKEIDSLNNVAYLGVPSSDADLLEEIINMINRQDSEQPPGACI